MARQPSAQPAGTPADVVIPKLILKHLFDWSYDDLRQEVRANLVSRLYAYRCSRLPALTEA
jgi:hypothetical protein